MTFTIILKLEIVTENQITEWEKTRKNLNSQIVLAGKRILLCEDHPLNAKIATRLLSSRGIIVDYAENGKIAVDMFIHSVANYYDAILMDIRMPVMDGLEATRKIRNLPRRDARVVPIIAMTANALSDDVNETKKAGMDAHLSKPIEIDILFETLNNLLIVDNDIRRRQILVVDDVEMNREIIKVSLENEYVIFEARNGKEALENERGIDVVITDIQMPEMDGIDLIKSIKKNNNYRHIVIIANTQFGDANQEEMLLEIGANDFVYKPTTPRIVAIRVQNALRRI